MESSDEHDDAGPDPAEGFQVQSAFDWAVVGAVVALGVGTWGISSATGYERFHDLFMSMGVALPRAAQLFLNTNPGPYGVALASVGAVLLLVVPPRVPARMGRGLQAAGVAAGVILLLCAWCGALGTWQLIRTLERELGPIPAGPDAPGTASEVAREVLDALRAARVETVRTPGGRELLRLDYQGPGASDLGYAQLSGGRGLVLPWDPPGTESGWRPLVYPMPAATWDLSPAALDGGQELPLAETLRGSGPSGVPELNYPRVLDCGQRGGHRYGVALLLWRDRPPRPTQRPQAPWEPAAADGELPTPPGPPSRRLIEVRVLVFQDYEQGGEQGGRAPRPTATLTSLLAPEVRR
ncbi:MAG: hypothetical protein AB7N76_06230 [Planctomycetota bacterium]